MRRARPLSVAAAGLVLVAFDLRVVALDLAPDVAGWALVLAAALHLGLRAPAVAAAVAAIASTGDLVLPGGVRLIDPGTDRVVERCPPEQMLQLGCYEEVRFDPLSGWRLALLALAVGAGAGAVMALLAALRTRAAAVAEEGTGGAADAAAAVPRLRRLDLATIVWALPQLAAMGWAQLVGEGRYDAVWDEVAEYVALIGLVALAVVALDLARHRGERWGLPAAWQRSSTWTKR